MKYMTSAEYMCFASDVARVRDVPTSAHKRWELSRKEFAASVRALFKSLGIKNISVTAPNYSMAQGIDIRLPHPQADRVPFSAPAEDHAVYAQEVQMLRETRQQVRDQLRWILETAYPEFRDRSDVQSDYFDYKWSID